MPDRFSLSGHQRDMAGLVYNGEYTLHPPSVRRAIDELNCSQHDPRHHRKHDAPHFSRDHE